MGELGGISAVAQAFLYAAGSVVCHQIPERSFHLAGVQLPVCARCTGLYLGGLAGVAVWMSLGQRLRSRLGGTRRAVIALAIAGAPTLVTWLSAEAGLGEPANLGRAMLAVPLGVAAGAVAAAVARRDLR